MLFDPDDTIAAIATAPGGALRGIVRVSGPQCRKVIDSLVVWDDAQEPAPKLLPTCGRGIVHLGGELGYVPATIYLWPTNSSYTRQPSAELHLPGSGPVLEAALEAVCKSGARLARPGEFTMRAFLAGRLDLTQAEAVLGVIDAQSAAELDTALAQLAGGLARPLAALRERLLDLLSHLEAGLDFVEEDIEFISAAEMDRQLMEAAESIAVVADQMQSRGEAGRLPRIVLMGEPNAGKSSLLNALAGDDAAIVSEIAGTTRDFVTRRVRFGGRDCLITDTAGTTVGEAASELEAAAQGAANQQIEQADLTVLCIDSSCSIQQAVTRADDAKPIGSQIVVLTKCDLRNEVGGRRSEVGSQSLAISTSSRTGQGLDDLRRAIDRALLAGDGDRECAVAGTADRCRESLRLTSEALVRARVAIQSGNGEEFVAAEVRVALEELGRVVGAVYTDDILDCVFSRFCIGK